MLRTIIIFIAVFILLTFIKSFIKSFRLRKGAADHEKNSKIKSKKKKDNSNIVDAKYEEIK